MKKSIIFNKDNSHKCFFKVFACLIFVVSLGCSSLDDYSTELSIKDFPNRSLDFSLWQLDSFYQEVQMGYILRVDDGKIIVIDGGGKLTAPILNQYLQQFGGVVDTWIITHPHSDHIGAFLEIAKGNDINVNHIVHAPLSNSWVKQNELANYNKVVQYNQTLESLDIDVRAMEEGNVLNLAAGVQMKVFSASNEDIVTNAINNSSLVFKITSKSKSILFLGDLGELGGSKLLKKCSDYSILQSDYVQMSHHGQAGVDKAFYEAVNASYALWPTPKWLWNNQLEGENSNSGTYKTLTVRKWMEELGIKQNYVSGLEGNLQID